MEYTLLGSTGVRVSRVALGTALLGLTPDEEGATELIHAAVDLGINVFDCANTYGNRASFDRPGLPPASQRKHAEELLGRAIKRHRDDVLVCTKVGEPVGDGANDGGLIIPGVGGRGGGLSRFHVMREVERSLRRLGTDHIDIYHLHHPDPDTPVEETLEVMADLVAQGKIRYVGLSDHQGWQLTKAVLTSRQSSLPRPVLNQVQYNLIRRSVEREVVPAALDLGLGLTCFSPLAGGLLAGREALERPVTGIARWGVPGGVADTDRTAALRLDELARSAGLEPASAAMRWLLDRPGVSAAIVGPESVAELKAAVGAMEVQLTPELRGELDQIGDSGAVGW